MVPHHQTRTRSLVALCRTVVITKSMGNVSPCEPRHPPCRDASIVLASQVSPSRVLKVPVRILVFFGHLPLGIWSAARKIRSVLVILSIIPFAVSKPALALYPCFIAAFQVYSDFGAFRRQFREPRRLSQALGTLSLRYYALRVSPGKEVGDGSWQKDLVRLCGVVLKMWRSSRTFYGCHVPTIFGADRARSHCCLELLATVPSPSPHSLVWTEPARCWRKPLIEMDLVHTVP